MINPKNDIAQKLDTDKGILVFNPNSFEGESAVAFDGKTVYVKDIPVKGYKVIKEVKSENKIKLLKNLNRFLAETLTKFLFYSIISYT